LGNHIRGGLVRGASITQLATQVLDQLTTVAATIGVPNQSPEDYCRASALLCSAATVVCQSTGTGYPAYNIPVAVHWAAQHGSAARSVNEIIKRHEVLQTSFVVMEGEPVQVIASAPITLSEVDLRQLPMRRKAEEQRLTTGGDSALRPGAQTVVALNSCTCPRRVYAALHHAPHRR